MVHGQPGTEAFPHLVHVHPRRVYHGRDTAGIRLVRDVQAHAEAGVVRGQADTDPVWLCSPVSGTCRHRSREVAAALNTWPGTTRKAQELKQNVQC